MSNPKPIQNFQQQSNSDSQDTTMRLVDGIGVYNEGDPQESNAQFAASRLSVAGHAELYSGTYAYKAKHRQKINTYEQSAKGRMAVNYPIDDPHYFRKAFIDLIATIDKADMPKYVGDANIRKTHPELATTSMAAFLGKKGLALYKLALEEESQSKEYMDAVFRKSTNHFEGEKWQNTRPVIIVAGPSGCGKSTAAKSAVQKTVEFLPKEDGNFSGNDVVSVDGGDARAVSQMRKLVILTANNHGFSGLKDLHDRSGALDKAKARIQKAAFKTPSLGVVIPETFSQWFNPISKIRSLMRTIDKLPNTKQIFCQVTGKNPSLFPAVVHYWVQYVHGKPLILLKPPLI